MPNFTTEYHFQEMQKFAKRTTKTAKTVFSRFFAQNFVINATHTNAYDSSFLGRPSLSFQGQKQLMSPLFCPFLTQAFFSVIIMYLTFLPFFSRLTKGRAKARQRKMHQIAQLLELPGNVAPGCPSPPSLNLHALRKEAAAQSKSSQSIVEYDNPGFRVQKGHS